MVLKFFPSIGQIIPRFSNKTDFPDNAPEHSMACAMDSKEVYVYENGSWNVINTVLDLGGESPANTSDYNIPILDSGSLIPVNTVVNGGANYGREYKRGFIIGTSANNQFIYSVTIPVFMTDESGTMTIQLDSATIDFYENTDDSNISLDIVGDASAGGIYIVLKKGGNAESFKVKGFITTDVSYVH